MNSSERESFDAIVIGAGQAGGPLAGTLGKAGWQVALIEREHVGGTCVNEGCTPTKTMVASARVAHLARRAADYGVQLGGVQAGEVAVDLARVRERTQKLVKSFRSGSQRSLEKVENVTLLLGEARFVSPPRGRGDFGWGRQQAHAHGGKDLYQRGRAARVAAN